MALLHHFIYNARGQVELRSEGVASSVDPAYDRIGRLTSLAHAFAGGGGNVTLGFTLHNPASQIDTRTRNNDSYAWIDDYDADVSRSYTVNGLNQYTAAGGTTFSYDANGNLTSDGSDSYVYDVENRLVSASAGHTATLRYDPLGRLFEVTGTGTPRRFLWDGDALVAEYTSTGSLGARFVHGTATGVDDPLVWYGGGENRRLHADHQGSIVAITDGTGAIKWINGYDEWGIPNAPNNTGRFQYTGQAWIGELGMYHYKARIYSPTLGRFLQTDPVGYDDQVNLYAYVGNDPMNRVDPDGQWMCGSNSAAQCRAISQALRQANQALRNMRGAEAARLRTSLAAWGREGQDNDVVVQAANMRGVMNTSTSDGVTTVSINSRINSFTMLQRASIGSAAGTVVHEGRHIHDETRVLGGRNPRTDQERYNTERHAYRVQGEVDRALGVASSGAYRLWSPSWGANERRMMEQGARDNAWLNACRSGCPGIDAW